MFKEETSLSLQKKYLFHKAEGSFTHRWLSDEQKKREVKHIETQFNEPTSYQLRNLCEFKLFN